MAAASSDLWDNPLGTDGFEFVEYAAPDPDAMGRLFEPMGFTAVARHRAKNVLLYRQGSVNFIVNAEPDFVVAPLEIRSIFPQEQRLLLRLLVAHAVQRGGRPPGLPLRTGLRVGG